MAILKSEDNQPVSSVELQAAAPPKFTRDGALWQPCRIQLVSGRHQLAMPVEAKEGEACLLCRKPLDEVAKLRILLLAMSHGEREKVLFEPQEPTFELCVERTPEKGFKVEFWIDAGNASTGFYSWDAAGVRFYTTAEHLVSFIEELGRDFPEQP
jgi:hypothetical protein